MKSVWMAWHWVCRTGVLVFFYGLAGYGTTRGDNGSLVLGLYSRFSLVFAVAYLVWVWTYLLPSRSAWKSFFFLLVQAVLFGSVSLFCAAFDQQTVGMGGMVALGVPLLVFFTFLISVSMLLGRRWLMGDNP